MTEVKQDTFFKDLAIRLGAGLAVGGVTGGYREGIVIEDNDSRWSGSHLMDPDLVPGTIVTQRALKSGMKPGLEDITATLYSLFDVSPPEGIDGKPLFE